MKIELDLPKPTPTKEYFSLRKKVTQEAIKRHKPTNWQNYSIHYEGNILRIEQE